MALPRVTCHVAGSARCCWPPRAPSPVPALPPRLVNYSQRHRAASAISFRPSMIDNGVEEQGGRLWALLPLERDKTWKGTHGLANTGPIALGGSEVPAAAALPPRRPPTPSSSHAGSHRRPPLLPLPLFGASRHTFQRRYENSRWTWLSGTSLLGGTRVSRIFCGCRGGCLALILAKADGFRSEAAPGMGRWGPALTEGGS